MPRTRELRWVAAALWLASAGQVQAVGTCDTGPYRQFDFWIGDWDVADRAHPTVLLARAHVNLILDGCVLHEMYEAKDGHKGESFTIFDATRNTWHQSWVTDRGNLLTIEGHLQGQAMILEGTDHLPDGTPRQVRGEWRPDPAGVREIAARSTDAGVTWMSWFDLVFKPHAPAAP
jgi:hypothetical protein